MKKKTKTAVKKMEGSNQEEPTKISKENTYTYWVDKDKQNNANITKKEP